MDNTGAALINNDLDSRYGALINRFNRMICEDVHKLVQMDFGASTIFGGVAANGSPGNYLLGYGLINRARAGANQSQHVMERYHADSRYAPGAGIINDLAWRLNTVGVYVDPHQMARVSANVATAGCRLAGEFHICCGTRPGRKLVLRADNVNQTMLDEVCNLVKFNTKGRRIDSTGLIVRQAGRTIFKLHRTHYYIENAAKLLAVYAIISDHTAYDYLCSFDTKHSLRGRSVMLVSKPVRYFDRGKGGEARRRNDFLA